jgi:hypothetical protein
MRRRTTAPRPASSTPQTSECGGAATVAAGASASSAAASADTGEDIENLRGACVEVYTRRASVRRSNAPASHKNERDSIDRVWNFNLGGAADSSGSVRQDSTASPNRRSSHSAGLSRLFVRLATLDLVIPIMNAYSAKLQEKSSSNIYKTVFTMTAKNPRHTQGRQSKI